MKKVIILLAICISFNGYSQELKKKKKTNEFSKEIYFINKENKLKHGDYVKLNVSTKDTIIKGHYENDKKIGKWTYFQAENKVNFIYDYDNEQICFLSQELKGKNEFLVKIENNFKLENVDIPSLYLGSTDEIKYHLQRVRLSDKIIKNGQAGISVIAIEIDKNGRASYSVKKSLDSSFEKNIIKTLEQFSNEWLPSKQNGIEKESQVLITYTIRPAAMSKLPLDNIEKPYSWYFELYFYGTAY